MRQFIKSLTRLYQSKKVTEQKIRELLNANIKL